MKTLQTMKCALFECGCVSSAIGKGTYFPCTSGRLPYHDCDIKSHEREDMYVMDDQWIFLKFRTVRWLNNVNSQVRSLQNLIREAIREATIS